MRYYTIVNNSILIAQNKQALLNYYSDVFELPSDYVQGKYIVENNELVLNPNWEEEQERKEKERISLLNLTGADVERGIYKAKGMDFEDIIEYVTALPIDGLNIKELKIELKANHFYRGNPYVSAVGNMLGFTPKQLDNFFEYNDYLYLTNCELEVVATPTEAIVELNGVEQKQITVPYASEILGKVSCEGYKTQEFTITLKQNDLMKIDLIKTEGSEVIDV